MARIVLPKLKSPLLAHGEGKMSQTKRSGKTVSRSMSGRKRKQRGEARTLLMIGIPILVIGAVLVLLYNNSQSSIADDNARLVRDDSPIYGAAEAPVSLVEFLDPECESCRSAYPAIKEIIETYDGRVRLIVRYSPRHVNSVLALMAIEAAGEQGRYWEMMDLLFTRQPEWGEQRVETPQVFTAYAQELGLDMTQFQAAMQNPIYREKIERDRQDGEALGVDGTPTFFVNGELVEPLNYDRLIAMIDAALDG